MTASTASILRTIIRQVTQIPHILTHHITHPMGLRFLSILILTPIPILIHIRLITLTLRLHMVAHPILTTVTVTTVNA
jgi:hypothetical protein